MAARFWEISRFCDPAGTSGNQERVARQDQEIGDRIDHQPEQGWLVVERFSRLLTQTQQLGAQVVLHLGAVENFFDDQAFDYVFSEQNPAAFRHVVKFDGEAVGGSAHFFLAHQQRRRIASRAPPFEDGLGIAQRFGGGHSVSTHRTLRSE